MIGSIFFKSVEKSRSCIFFRSACFWIFFTRHHSIFIIGIQFFQLFSAGGHDTAKIEMAIGKVFVTAHGTGRDDFKEISYHAAQSTAGNQRLASGRKEGSGIVAADKERGHTGNFQCQSTAVRLLTFNVAAKIMFHGIEGRRQHRSRKGDKVIS